MHQLQITRAAGHFMLLIERRTDLLVKSRKASGTTQVWRSERSSIPIGQAQLTAC